MIGEYQNGPLLLVEPLETGNQRGQPFRTISRRERIERFGARPGDVGNVVERRGAQAPDFVERPIARNSRNPCERRSPRRVEIGGALPDADIDILERVAGRVPALKDPEYYPESFALVC